MATCVMRSGRSAVALDPKKSRSPFENFRMAESAETSTPICACWLASRFNSMPFRRKTVLVKPEQSMPLGDVPPQRYGTPMKRFAVCSTLTAVSDRVAFHLA